MTRPYYSPQELATDEQIAEADARREALEIVRALFPWLREEVITSGVSEGHVGNDEEAF